MARPARLTPAGRLLVIAVALTAIRLLAAAAIPLTEDEAYYRLWAQHLQLGYLDHPPMIAWWIRLGELVAGDTVLGVRLLPCLATGITTWLVGDLARRLGLSAPTAERAALWYNATFTVALGGLLATPDTPACLFWTVALWALARRRQGGSGAWWPAAGAAAGLACLSKYTGLFLAPGVLLWLLATPGGLAELRRPWPWLAALCAAAVFAPHVLWNAQHGWMTFEKQFARVEASHLEPGRLAEFLVTQFLLLNPLIATLAARGGWLAWRERRGSVGIGMLAPVAASLPFLLYLAVHSLHDRVQGHWPAPLFGALAILAAVAAPRGDTLRAAAVRLFTPLCGFAASAAILVAMVSPIPLLGPSDPTLAIRGWPEFARDVEALRERHGATWVGTESYGVYAQLAGENVITTPLLEVIERDRYRRDEGLIPDFNRPGLVVDLSRRMKVVDVGRCFTEVTPVADLGRAGGASRNQRYSAFLVSGPKRDVWYRGCPAEVRPGVWR